MAGAARVPLLLLLLLLAAVALPALVQGFVPIGTFQRQHGGDPSLHGDAWRRSSSAKGAGAGDLHPLHHYPKSFHHNFIRRPGKSLLEDAPGEERGLEIHPTWQRRYHGQHHRHAEGHHGDVGLAGEHPGHRGQHAGSREHHRRERLPARMMREGEWREGESVPYRVGHRRHAHGAKHWSAHRAGREFGEDQFRHFRDTGRVRDARPHEVRGPAGAWESFKSKLAYGASSVAAKIQSAGNHLRNWVSPSRPRVAPTVSFAAEPLWLNAPSLSSCGGLDTKYRDLLVEVLEDVSVSTTSGISCTETLELQTRRLMHTLKRRLIASCSKDVEADCEQSTCNFINRYPQLATAIVLSKFQIDPVSSIKSTCNSKDIADVYRNIHHLSRRVHASLDILPLENSAENQADVDAVKPVCEVCLEKNLDKLKEMFSEQLLQTCQQAACPKLKDACDFVRDHGVLGRTLLILKFKPWLKVAQSCASSCSASPLPLSLITSTAISSVEGETPSWQYLRREPSQPAIFNLHRAMQLRGFVSSDAMELSRLFDRLQNVGSNYPHFVIVEFVRQNPLAIHEMLATMHQPVDAVKLEGEDKQADKVPVEDKEASANGAPATMNQALVVGGEEVSFNHWRPEGDAQVVSDSGDEPDVELSKESGPLPAEEPLKEQFFRALNHVFGEGVRSTLLPEDPVALSGNKGLQAVSSAEASQQTGASRADM